jgi:hypothetical protein
VGRTEQGWINLLLAGNSEETVLSTFLATVYAILSEDASIDALYAVLLGRAPSMAELIQQESVLPWVGSDGVTTLVLTSPEYRTDVVLADYAACLHSGMAVPGLAFGQQVQAAPTGWGRSSTTSAPCGARGSTTPWLTS